MRLRIYKSKAVAIITLIPIIVIVINVYNKKTAPNT